MLGPIALLVTYLVASPILHSQHVAVPGNTTEAPAAETILPVTEIPDETTLAALEPFDVTSEPPHRAKRSDDPFTSVIPKALAGLIKMNMALLPEAPTPRGPAIYKRL